MHDHHKGVNFYDSKVYSNLNNKRFGLEITCKSVHDDLRLLPFSRNLLKEFIHLLVY